MSKEKGVKKAVRPDIAQLYHDYLDLKDSLGDGLGEYRKLACDQPQNLDVPTIAATLSGLIEFDEPTTAMFIAGLNDESGALTTAFASVRGGIRVASNGAGIIAACETHGCTSTLDEALELLFIEEHEDDFDLDTGVDPLPESEEDDDDDDLPETAPDGYPSDDSDDDDKEDC